MDETNFDWDDLRLFIAVARNNGLAGAAASTGKSAPTLGRRMLALEKRLGQELFRRLPRGYELTDAGQNLFAQAMQVEHSLSPILEIDPVQTRPIVKISAGAWVTHLLCNNISELTGDDPMRLRFISANEKLDIARREAVIGIRNQRPVEAGLAGRKIGPVRFALYANGANVKTWAQVISSTPSAKWMEEQAKGDAIIEVNTPRNALDLALAGAARIVLPVFVGAMYPALKKVSADISLLQHDQWLVSHHEERFEPEVRKVIERAFAILKRAHAKA